MSDRRLFIALPLPDPVRTELAAVQERLRRATQAVRWVAPANMHLTLQFLGATDAALVQPLLSALEAIPPFALALRLAGLDGFPGNPAPRVLWAGVSGDIPDLKRLYAAVLQATAKLGFRAEGRPFHPHITLGRVPPTATLIQVNRIKTTLSTADPPAPTAWNSAGPLLYASTLTPHGAVYEALGPAESHGLTPTHT